MNIAKKFDINVNLVLLVLSVALFPQVQGELKTINITGKISNKEITFDVYLPENYNKNGAGYPVIYSLHGRGGSHKSGAAFRVSMEKAIAKGILPPVIAVYPDGTKNGWYADAKDRSILIETNIIREIIP